METTSLAQWHSWRNRKESYVRFVIGKYVLMNSPLSCFDVRNSHVCFLNSMHNKKLVVVTLSCCLISKSISHILIFLAILSCLWFVWLHVWNNTNFRWNANRSQISGPWYLWKLSLLRKACDLIKNYHECYNVVVNVARKPDARDWADLFSAALSSTTNVFFSLYLSLVSL